MNLHALHTCFTITSDVWLTSVYSIHLCTIHPWLLSYNFGSLFQGLHGIYLSNHVQSQKSKPSECHQNQISSRLWCELDEHVCVCRATRLCKPLSFVSSADFVAVCIKFWALPHSRLSQSLRSFTWPCDFSPAGDWIKLTRTTQQIQPWVGKKQVF